VKGFHNAHRITKECNVLCNKCSGLVSRLVTDYGLCVCVCVCVGGGGLIQVVLNATTKNLHGVTSQKVNLRSHICRRNIKKYRAISLKLHRSAAQAR
jgi:hypothetical protein